MLEPLIGSSSEATICSAALHTKLEPSKMLHRQQILQPKKKVQITRWNARSLASLAALLLKPCGGFCRVKNKLQCSFHLGTFGCV
jgi:hypothetical protein